MSRFPPPDPVADALQERFGPEFGAAFAGQGRFSLEPLRATLAALGHPERALPPVIHIAGTNGKGSCAAFCAAILGAAGLRVHRFTQPHLFSTCERIAPLGTPITEKGFLALIDRVAAVAAPGLSHFEAQTACAFLAFAETPADAAVIEVGVGGKDDATVVIPKPAVSVITRIGRDHLALLGPTLPLVALAKAGIVKPGAPVVTAPQEDPAIDRIFEAAAMRARSPLLMGGLDWTVHPAGAGFFLDTESASYHLPQPSLPGAHQYENAALAALACLTLAPDHLTEDVMAQGIAGARWPGRLQRLRAGPLAAIAQAAKAALFVDGGHNPDAADALAVWIRSQPETACVLVVGMMADKDLPGFIAPLAPVVRGVVTVPAKGPRPSARPADLRAAVRAHGHAALNAGNLGDAVVKAAGLLPATGGRILIAGSLGLAAEALWSETSA
jgi:dihydrofolate synthase/folylpolyglutamate synthase